MFYLYSQPYYGASNGIKICYLLVRYLHELGFGAAIACPDPQSPDRPPPEGYEPPVVYSCGTSLRIGPDDIAIYPEIITGNPLGARRVVRYLLNRPYYLNGKGIDYGPNDFLTTCSKAIDPDLPQLCILSDERLRYRAYNRPKKRDQVAVYFGKTDLNGLGARMAALADIVRRYRRVALVTRRHPADRAALFRIIAESRLLVSFDPITSMGYEATLLGTPVVMLDDSFGVLDAVDGIPLYGFSADLVGVGEAEAEVPKAISYYESYIESQRGQVKRWADSVAAHFDRIEAPSEDEYRRFRSGFIAEQCRIDEKRFRERRDAAVLENINYLNEIPDVALKPLRKRTAVTAARIGVCAVKIVKAALKTGGAFGLAKSLYQSGRAVFRKR
jgi:hypothetical protein